MTDGYEIHTSVAIAGTFVCLYYGRNADSPNPFNLL